MENIVVALKESRTPIPLAGMNQADQDLAVYIYSLPLPDILLLYTHWIPEQSQI